MNKLLLLMLTSFLSSAAIAISQQEYAQLFRGYQACFILYDLNEHKIVSEYNPNNRCHERLSPNSTFKIPLSLMAFNQNIINQKTEFKWDGKKYDVAEWNRDQDPKSWLKYSVLWASQQITPMLGYARIKHYLAAFDYGNQDFSGDPGKNNGLTHAWLASSLKISAYEQLNFLQALFSDELPLIDDAIINTKENIYLGKLANGYNYYGKTGSGLHGRNERLSNSSKLRDGWFIGLIENANSDKRYVFVSNLTDKKIPRASDKNGNITPYGGQVLKPITLKILNDYFKP